MSNTKYVGIMKAAIDFCIMNQQILKRLFKNHLINLVKQSETDLFCSVIMISCYELYCSFKKKQFCTRNTIYCNRMNSQLLLLKTDFFKSLIPIKPATLQWKTTEEHIGSTHWIEQPCPTFYMIDFTYHIIFYHVVFGCYLLEAHSPVEKKLFSIKRRTQKLSGHLKQLVKRM